LSHQASEDHDGKQEQIARILQTIVFFFLSDT
jgi:hypothetical protein